MSECAFFDVRAAMQEIQSGGPAETADSAEAAPQAGYGFSKKSNFSNPAAGKFTFGEFLDFLADKSREGFRVHFYESMPGALAPVYPDHWTFDERMMAQTMFVSCVDEIIANKSLVQGYAQIPTEVLQ